MYIKKIGEVKAPIIYISLTIIIALTACVAGIVPQYIINGDDKMAMHYIDELANIFDDVYLEVQPHDFKEQHLVNDKLVDFAGAGATIPLPSFGNSLAKAAIKEVKESGFVGAFSGGIKGAAAGITASIFFGYLMAVIFNPKTKN